MSKNMVERVAEAMEEAAGSWAEGRLEIPEECPYPILARAAIEAMRPGLDELEAARSAVKARALWDPASDVSTSADVALDTFFDAALKP